MVYMLLAGNVLNIDNILCIVAAVLLLAGAMRPHGCLRGVAPAVLPITHSPYSKAVE